MLHHPEVRIKWMGSTALPVVDRALVDAEQLGELMLTGSVGPAPALASSRHAAEISQPVAHVTG